MSESTIILNRKILASFLPNHEAVKAFESIIKSVVEVTPSSIEELTFLSAKEKRGNENALLARIEQLELLISRHQSLKSIEDRLKNLESIIGV